MAKEQSKKVENRGAKRSSGRIGKESLRNQESDRAFRSYLNSFTASSGDVVGIDQADISSRAALDVATRLLQQKPAFWGRYFKGPGNTHPIQYQPSRENRFFQDQRIRVLPVARQTSEVGGNEQLGLQHGLRNAAAVMAAFDTAHLAQMPNGVRVFLDVEPSHPLSMEYYKGWSEGLLAGGREVMIDFRDEIDAGFMTSGNTVRFRPCVYGHHRADATWRALGRAISDGAACDGAWVVYMDNTPDFPIWPWRASFTSRYMPLSVPVLACQRILDWRDSGQNLDYNLANPAHDAEFLSTLVLPVA